MSSRTLKILAIIIMTIDHLGVVLNTLHSYSIAGNDVAHHFSDAYWQMRAIGRMAFPIFCVLIAEGCAHTRDIKRYIGRLALFAVIAQIPYQAFIHISSYGAGSISEILLSYGRGNVLVTLALGAVAVLCYGKAYQTGSYKRVLYILGIPAAFAAVLFLRGEYDVYGILLILSVYVFRRKNESDADFKVFGNKYAQVICLALITYFCYAYVYGQPVYYIIGAVLSALPLFFYNGKPGKRGGKWAFYIYYPAHMLALSVVMYAVMG